MVWRARAQRPGRPDLEKVSKDPGEMRRSIGCRSQMVEWRSLARKAPLDRLSPGE
ncbi:hypothetical protein GDI2995 [Gluconacetobacter diazotrophicus PA1 5]|uniref:Uncharacterized protein n=1 Tax=Gluconacetobacter diazotrophicus (strain ATCC 49037 / DSM 5601 / CCUG 37298 / CIP 103539 / LMG 7603 / PAl5) TaxID=272568 RepID=A9HRL7_GLUDA|nr:hypothetical protein GDI2995 [Gluconacetobacter diazotrophicus PA1 5]